MRTRPPVLAVTLSLHLKQVVIWVPPTLRLNLK